MLHISTVFLVALNRTEGSRLTRRYPASQSASNKAKVPQPVVFAGPQLYNSGASTCKHDVRQPHAADTRCERVGAAWLPARVQKSTMNNRKPPPSIVFDNDLL